MTIPAAMEAGVEIGPLIQYINASALRFMF